MEPRVDSSKRSSFSSIFRALKSCTQICFSKKIKFENEGITVAITSKTIGEGSYSDVLKGIDTNSLQKYAIKKMIIQSTDTENSVKMEIESFQRFQHTNILQCLAHKYIIDNGSYHMKQTVYLLFPLISNGNLREQLNGILSNKTKPLSFIHVLHCIKHISEALNVLHSYSPSYVHNDIKPENILISDDGQPLLTDFGSVRLADIQIATRNDSLRVAEESTLYCTLQYRPPELHDPPVGSTLDSRTDVWGMGCLFYAWWFGYSPYEISYDKNGFASPSDCSYLRVLSGALPVPPKPTPSDNMLLALLGQILIKDINSRPYTNLVIEKIELLIQNVSNNDVV